MGSDGGNMHLLNCVDEVSKHGEVCQGFDKAPHKRIAGTPAVSMSAGKLQVDLVFLEDVMALRAMDVFSKYSFLIPVRARSPQEVRSGFCG